MQRYQGIGLSMGLWRLARFSQMPVALYCIVAKSSCTFFLVHIGLRRVTIVSNMFMMSPGYAYFLASGPHQFVSEVT